MADELDDLRRGDQGSLGRQIAEIVALHLDPLRAGQARIEASVDRLTATTSNIEQTLVRLDERGQQYVKVEQFVLTEAAAKRAHQRLDDHESRLDALESHRNRTLGALAVAGVFIPGATALLVRWLGGA